MYLYGIEISTKVYQELSRICFNCTFMELKLDVATSLHFTPSGFNCTFMELKYKKGNYRAPPEGGLIVPLWNWNFDIRECVPSDHFVLIVPLWNWNRCSSYRVIGDKCFNCTFMELKFVISSFVMLTTSSFNCTFMELKLIFAAHEQVKSVF